MQMLTFISVGIQRKQRECITDRMKTIEKEKYVRPFDDGFIFPLKGVIVVRSYVNVRLLAKTNS